jgi:hypothetical protein
MSTPVLPPESAELAIAVVIPSYNVGRHIARVIKMT